MEKADKMYNLFFSPTNTTKTVLHFLNKSFDMKFEDIELTSYQNNNTVKIFSKEDVVFIGVPSYAGRVPITFAGRLLRNIKGNGAKAVLVVTFGNRAYDDTLIELKDLTKNCDFKVIAATAIVTQHSLVPDFGKGRPDNEDKKEILEWINVVKEKLMISNDNTKIDIIVPGNRPYKKVKAMPLAPAVNSSDCLHCGACSIACPTNAIDNRTYICDASKCISCICCVNICPVNCRFVEPEILNKLKAHLEPLCDKRKHNEFYL